MKYVTENCDIVAKDITHSKLKWYTKSELYHTKDTVHPYLWRGLADAGLV
jgi:hypothetical protein